MSRPTRVLLLALAAAAAVAAIVIALVGAGILGRGDGSGGVDGTTPGAGDLSGTWVSTSVGSTTPHPLVDGRPIRIQFSGGRIDANAGCNQMGGTASVTGGRLVVGQLVQTEMACEPVQVMDQEAWFHALVDARPTVTLSDGRLVLRWDGYTLVLDRAADSSPGPRPTVPGPGSPSMNTIPETPQSSAG